MPSLKIADPQVVPGRHYNTPKELWGFRLQGGAGRPKDLALAVLKANAEQLGLVGVIGSLHCRREKQSVGGWHVVFSQRVGGHRVHRAYVTVHMNRHRETYLIKNRAVPRAFLPEPSEKHEIGTRECRRLAMKAVARGDAHVDVRDVEQLWFPMRTRLHAAFKYRIHRSTPRQEWIVYVDATTGRVLSKYDNLSEATGHARVFDPNPVVALATWDRLLDHKGQPVDPPDDAYERVRLTGLKKTGYLDGDRVTTKLTRPRVKRQPNLRFEFRSNQRGFDEAMVYFHVNRAIEYIESLGYRGARKIFSKAIAVDANGTTEDNSWYSPGQRTLTFGTGDVDDAEDGETILHEFGHALQDAICPDFGQSAEAAAMGEGFGDYFAASMSAEKKMKTGADFLLSAVMTWDGIVSEDEPSEEHPPCVRRLDEPLTYESFSHATSADEHDNGLIWSATLWDIWNEVGRDVADAIIIESHFQLDGFTSLSKGARAILDADRNLRRGRHVARLTRIFHRRGIGPVE